MSFAEQLYNVRTKNNMTQEELAEKLDISLSKLYRWESGQNTPNLSELKALCLTFNETPDYFLEWENVTPETKQKVVEELYIEKNKISKQKIGTIFACVFCGLLLTILVAACIYSIIVS